jgi:hypothetical protein
MSKPLAIVTKTPSELVAEETAALSTFTESPDMRAPRPIPCAACNGYHRGETEERTCLVTTLACTRAQVALRDAQIEGLQRRADDAEATRAAEQLAVSGFLEAAKKSERLAWQRVAVLERENPRNSTMK